MKFCMNCGAQMEDADVFCQKCGYRAVMLEEPAPAEPAAREEARPAGAGENSAPRQEVPQFSWDGPPEGSSGDVFRWDTPEENASAGGFNRDTPEKAASPAGREREPERDREPAAGAPEPQWNFSGGFSQQTDPAAPPQGDSAPFRQAPAAGAPEPQWNFSGGFSQQTDPAASPQGDSAPFRQAPAADQQLWGTPAAPPQQGGRAVGQPWETPAASPKKRKTLLLILIIVAAVVLMAAGGFVYLKLNDMKLSDLFSGAEEGAAAEDVPGEQSPGTDKDAGASGKRKPAESEDYYGTWSMNGSQVAYYEIGPADPDAAEIRFHFNRTGYKPYYELDGDGTGTLENGVLRVPMYYVFYKEDSRGNATQMGFGPFEETWTFAADLPEDYVLSEAEQLMTDTGYPAPDWEDCRTSGDYLVRRAEQQPEKLNEYVLWFSSDVFVSEEDVSLLSDTEFRFALNEIYARHGKKFSAGDLQSYFDSLSWYMGTVEEDAFDESCLNDFERENVAFLSRYQKNDSVAEANDVPLSEEECIGWTAKIDEVIGGTERPNMATVWTGDTGLDEVMRKNGVSDYEVRFYYDRDFNLLKAEAVIDETCTEYYYYCVGPECYVIAQKGQDGTVYRPEISELISSITERGYKLGHG